ncbi:MAG: hypothetical protein ABIA76_05225 [Candidatus Diapherotrites archaeon]
MPRVHGRARPSKGKEQGAGDVFSASSNEFKSLNSSLLVLSQKMNYVVRNEKILGRNLLVLNKKLNALDKRVSEAGKDGGNVSGFQESISELSDTLARNSEKLMELEALMGQLKDSFVSREEFEELKFVVDSINPVELMNIKSAEKFIERKMEEKMKKK